MNLSRFRSNRRDCRICRFGVMLVVCSLLVNMVCVPKAKAVVIDATAAFGAAAATAAINGTTATTLFTGMSTSAATNGIILYMDAYATATGAAASGTALAGTIGAGTIVTAAGALVLTAAAGYAVYKFIEWLREEKGLEAGGESVVVTSSNYFDGLNGSMPVDIATSAFSFEDVDAFASSSATWYAFGDGVSNGPLYSTVENNFWYLYYNDLQVLTSNRSRTHYCVIYAPNMPNYVFFPVGYVTASGFEVDGRRNFSFSDLVEVGMDDSFISESFHLQPNPEFQEIPQEIPEGQVLKINTGIESLSADDPQAAADAIMQTAIDGNLNPVVTVEADPTVTPDPDPDPDGSTEVEPDPDGPELPSNLGDLGEALTTRFPFSIPWDIYKAVKLLAAPSQAPYWEVDFLAPIAYRLPEGWKGSTKIVLDFGQPEYEIIGIASRWTSTIGFCLALAAATKRFIWTA